MDREILNDDANLAAMCEACNLGLRHSDGSITPRLYLILLARLMEAEISRKAASSEQVQLNLAAES